MLGTQPQHNKRGRGRGGAGSKQCHHKEDQLETRLMNLLRGTSPQGLFGIPESRNLNDNLLLVRPALKVSRTVLEEAAVSWREDESNQVNDVVRNRVRNELIPLMDSIAQRDVTVTINKSLPNKKPVAAAAQPE